MTKLALAVVLAAVTAVSGCGSNSDGATVAAPATAAAPSGAAPAPSTATGSQSGGAVLSGTVGTKDDADAFVITLTDAAGKPVTTLPAGDYQIKITDLSKIHNFHLKGGGVDETTTVPAVVDTTWNVTLATGEYTFICDPHPDMVGTFTVT